MIMKVSLVVILPFVFQIMLLPLTLKKVGEIRGRVGEIRAQKSLKPMQCFLYFPAPQKMYYVRFLFLWDMSISSEDTFIVSIFFLNSERKYKSGRN